MTRQNNNALPQSFFFSHVPPPQRLTVVVVVMMGNFKHKQWTTENVHRIFVEIEKNTVDWHFYGVNEHKRERIVLELKRKTCQKYDLPEKGAIE